MNDSEQWSNRFQFDLILINFSCELGQIMTWYDFLEARWMILSNVWTDSNLTWFHFGQLFIWIWVSNDQIWLPRFHMSDLEQCLKRTFGKFSVGRNPIINGGAIRPGGLLFVRKVSMYCKNMDLVESSFRSEGSNLAIFFTLRQFSQKQFD